MIRRLIAVLATALVLPSAASAASFAELPYTSAPRGVSCLRPTGVPGELLAWAPEGVQLRQATAGGLTPTATVALGHLQYCPVVAGRPNGAAVVAGIVGDTLAIAQRDAGGAWSAPQTVKVGNVASNGLAVGVSPSGYAVVAWVGQSAGTTAVHAVRRAPGGTFGAPELVSGTEKLSDVVLGVTAGIGDDGVAMVIWQPPALGRTPGGEFSIEQSMAAPDVPFSAPTELGTASLSSPKLAVAPDGRALVVFGDVGLRVSERPPGGSFGAPRSLSEDAGTGAVAIQPDGSAMVAWRSATGLVVARRTGTGPLGPPIQVLASSELGEQGIGGIAQFDGDPAPPEDDSGVDLRMLTAADGSTVFTWGDGKDVFGVATIRTRVAVLPAGAFTASAQTLGAPVRPVSTLAPVLAGGTPALAWGDFGADGLDGRLHYALQGAPAAAPEPPPVIRIGKPERTVVRSEQQVVIPVTCSAACDVGAHTSRDEFPLAVSLHHAGRTTLAFPASIAPVKAARVHIAIIASAPGAATVQNRSIDSGCGGSPTRRCRPHATSWRRGTGR